MSLTVDSIQRSKSLTEALEKEAQESYYSLQKRLGPNQIIHRSLHRIIRNNMQKHNAKREIEIAQNKERGWGALDGKPYQPLGEFNNVLEAFQKCKVSIPHTKETRVDTQKTINYMKNIKHPILKGKAPERCIKIIKKNQNLLERYFLQNLFPLLYYEI